MIDQIKKIAEQVEENESKKLLFESEITHLEEVLKHGVSSRFAEENAIYIYSPKTGHEIRKKLEDDYKLMHSKLSIPKKIEEELDGFNPNEGETKIELLIVGYYKSFISDELMSFCLADNGLNLCAFYLAGKALGVELVEVEG